MTSSQALLASALHVSVVKDFSYPSAMAYALHQCRCVCSHISPGILHPSPVATRQRDGTKGKRFLHLPAAVDHLPGAAPLVAWYGVRRSLDHSGGMAAIVVGFILTLASGCVCVSLLVSFFTSSQLTRWRGREMFEEDHKKGVEFRSVYHCMQMCTVPADKTLKSSLAWIDSCCHS